MSEAENITRLAGPGAVTQPARATPALGRWPRSLALGLGRGLWLAAVALVVVVFVLAVPARHAELERLCTAPACAEVQLRPADAAALAGLNLSRELYAGYEVVLEVVPASLYFLVALVIFRYRSDDGLALFLSLTLVAWGACLPPVIEALAHAAPVWRLLATLVQDLASASLVILLLVFPDGRFSPPWTKILALGWGGWNLVRPIFVTGTPFVLGQPETVVMMLVFVSAAAAQLHRFRLTPPGLLRQQTKWVVLGMSTMTLAAASYPAIHLLLPWLNEPGLGRLTSNLVALPLLLALPALMVPMTFGAAILRYRLWDIELLVNRALVYSSLTALLAGVYFGSVVAVQALFPAIGSQASPLAVAASTLATAAIFNPLRRRVQATIDRRFFRRRYDATQTLAAFAARARDDVNLAVLVGRLEAAVADTLQPTDVKSWLSSADGYAVYRPDEAAPLDAIACSDPLIAYLHQAPEVVALERLALESPALARLRIESVCLVAPLVSQGELIGWLSLGPRRGEAGYSRDDAQFLGLLADQSAPVVRAAQFAQRQQAEALETERLEQEMRLARLIQQRLLPAQLPAWPGWEAAACYQPARAVGGDFYDFVPYPDGRMGVVIGDVSGKGTPAALVMATTRADLHAAARDGASPGAVLSQANNLLLPDMPPGMFVTCLYLVLDPASGRLQMANAGQNLPYRLAGQGAAELRARGMPLGLMPDMMYEEREAVLAPGEALLLHSDGLVEARSPRGEMFGEQRLQSALCARPADSAAALVESLLQAVAQFTGPGAGPQDDVTLVMLRRLPGGST